MKTFKEAYCTVLNQPQAMMEANAGNPDFYEPYLVKDIVHLTSLTIDRISAIAITDESDMALRMCLSKVLFSTLCTGVLIGMEMEKGDLCEIQK